MRVFVTYSSIGYEYARDRICQEATACGVFDRIIAISENELTEELKESATYKVKRGNGLYSWKPDAIWVALQKCNEESVLVYCDAGCSLGKSREWVSYFDLLKSFDVLLFRSHLRNYQWVRKSVFDYYSEVAPTKWKEGYQMAAHVVMVRNTDNGRRFVNEWRTTMINHVELCDDVPMEQMSKEDSRFICNRYDQTILTALAYKYVNQRWVKILWEHFEGRDPFVQQAIRTTRLRKPGDVDKSASFASVLKRLMKTYLYFPIIGNYYNFKYKK